MSLAEDLQWRYATKKMNGKPVPQEKVDYILEAARMAPSSSGVQPYEIFVITSQSLKEKIKPIAWGQEQITDTSHLLVFASWDGYSLERIEKVFQKTLEERKLPPDTMDAYKERLWSNYEPLSQEWHAHHAAKQAYIAFGMAIAAAAEQRVDATPMEGFIPDELDKILGLKEKGLKSILLLPLGYRDEENDWLVKMKKVRTPKKDFITEL
ncbi:nitroreductase [Marivirga lumbricoides]|uniref:Nitroreductase n=1 Tax=Marivirga lumbricoides TaxID=1046115 RepID=A0ABQ1LPY5_9BACT|nr:nitroreductase [Marivirga lumbricoides]